MNTQQNTNDSFTFSRGAQCERQESWPNGQLTKAVEYKCDSVEEFQKLQRCLGEQPTDMSVRTQMMTVGV